MWLSLMVGIGLSTVASGIVWKWELAKTQQQFDRRADNLAFALQQNIDEYAQLTQALGAFYDAADRVSRADFTEFSQPFLLRYPGIWALGWAQRVLASEREAYAESMVAQGFRQFNIWERNADRKAIAASSRAEYLPSTYIESQEPFKQAIGFDHQTP
ncbi:MAG: CHASE domain-containing protein [Hormoscilla sp. GUM202]|nr:CHASE domain-containing protein [Hormoscilla sp. GUM202]